MKTIDEMIEFVYKLSRHNGSCRLIRLGALSTLEHVFGIPYAELADKMRAYEKAEHRAANEARRLANRAANEARRLANEARRLENRDIGVEE